MAAERVEIAFEDLFEDDADHSAVDTADVAGEWPEPVDLREGAEAAQEVSDAISELAEEIEEPRLQAPLEAWAEPFERMAAFYAEIDYDLEQLDTEDDEDLARLAEISLPVLLGPPWDAEEEAAFNQLLSALAEECPQLELGAVLDGAEPQS